jgi:hypothetical protein
MTIAAVSRQEWRTPKPLASNCRRSVTRLFLVAASLIAALTAAGAFSQAGAQTTESQSLCSPVVPCSDPRGCPDLVVDGDVLAQSWFIRNFRFSESDCTVIEGEVQAGKRRLLRFTSTTPNLGPGALIIGNPLDHPEWFDLTTCHRHQHFKEYADYRLWTPQAYQTWQALRAASPRLCARDVLAAHPELASQMVGGHKQGWCVVDIYLYGPPLCTATPDPSTYFDCAYQGLSVCWADEYWWSLDGQWVDTTGLAAGDYVLEEEVNAEHFFEEANYSNNSSAVPVTIKAHP